MKKYKEPEISFISLKPAENVANPCWAYASNDKGKPYYYNVSGEGFLEFQITSPKKEIVLYGNGNGCDGGTPTEVYYIVDKNDNGKLDAGEKTVAEQWQIDELKAAMLTWGGNSGEPVKSDDFSKHFPHGWS